MRRGTNIRNWKNLLRCRFFALLLPWFCATHCAGQSNDSIYSFVAPDSEFVMKVSRINNDIMISLSFDHNVAFDYLAIERKVDFENNFSQCKYITFDEVKSHAWVLVKKDRYPYSAQADMLYRVKYVTKDGVMRIFPAVFLPAVKD